ncbi:nuclear pore complex protein NUP93A-like isoform X1 [Glycine soja]|nr:nuclear pore complex protein NUP93A-like isoform X1 [Glycine soja]XP_040866017.1 nuclear pore complex protein NUP93A-like isoform X1 [Glycine max]
MPSMEIVPLTGRPIAEKKASVYAEAALGVGVGNLQRIRAFLWIRLRDYGVLDFDAGNARRLPLVDTTWQQLAEWINKGGMVPEEIAAAATEECERMLIVITH